ncbi:MAG: alkaline phosphatase family protein [Sphingomonadaceae bacterium]|nr:alkaline phosphatase family protein [Sphingomonadaceae bacterium]
MKRFFGHCLISAAAIVAHVIGGATALAAPVLMVSIDGLRADDISAADQKDLQIPTLRTLAAGGLTAAGVKGVLPTITYPSHITMITGVHPSRHGIVSNATFDPQGRNMGGWMWYAQDIKVPTLWDSVKAKGGTVASIGWPSSVGASSIDFHIPEYWRARIAEDEKLLRVVSTPGMADEIAHDTGVPFSHVALDYSDMDSARMSWVSAIIAKHKPRLTTLHLVTLDGARHKYGPDSPEAKATLAQIDKGLKTMIDKARAAQPDLVVAIVSDHGFAPVNKSLNLAAALAAEGLIQYGPTGKVESWSAYPWTMGGSAAILLNDPQDKGLEDRVRRILARLAADPANGIEKLLGRAEIAGLGGTSQAAFWVTMKSGYLTMASADKTLVQTPSYKGTHGYSPDNADMRSVFLLSGPGIAQRQVGVIDMRDIAPTIGDILEAQLPQYDGKIIK